jgi:hypothetical protein
MTAAALTTSSQRYRQHCPPELVWKRLAPLVAAPGRSRMRLWNPETEKFSDTAKRTDRLPARPAAVYLYTRGRTQLLWLDFDAKRHGAAAVAADMAAAAAWIIECGGTVVTDRSTSGGGHLICPLAIGSSASHDEMVPLVRLLGARLRTLDITPNTNAETGCMTPPGSPCREGGYRQLDGTLEAAVEAFTTRSKPDLLPRIYMLLGALKPSPRERPTITATLEAVAAYTDGIGENQRLCAHHTRNDALPPDVASYAARGIRSSTRPTWLSNHEARMSVVTQAIARGHSLSSLRIMIEPGGPWHDGLGKAYQRYHHRGDEALARDFTKALHWLVTNVLKSSPPRHKTKYSPGGQEGSRGPQQLREWLANALAWADQEFAGKRYRWTVHAVLQTLAFHAVVAGEQRSGTWLVGVGGRSLSLGSGLLSEDTIWRVLADLRALPGAPLVLARQHVGTEPDVYALTNQNIVTTSPGRVERVRIEPVHEAWIVLGHHLRRIYELVKHHGLTDKADIYAAAAVPRATGDAMVLDLETVGLLRRAGRGLVSCGPESLDHIAARHHLADVLADRLSRHQAERAAWRTWLSDREQLRNLSPWFSHTSAGAAVVAPHPRSPDDDSEHEAWLESVMSTGPPGDHVDDTERRALDMITDLLGGRIVAA